MFLAEQNDGNGIRRYLHTGVAPLYPPQEQILFSATPAAQSSEETQWYVDHIGTALDRPAGRFLFHFSAADLEERGGRITAAYRGRIAAETLIAARYAHFDGDGQLWFRGAYVDEAHQGRGIAPAMAALALIDWTRHGARIATATAAMLVESERPNKSVRAMEKLGFRLTDREDRVLFQSNYRDRHLLRHAEAHDGQPVLRYRRMYLRQEDLPRTLDFLRDWTGLPRLAAP